MPSILEKSDAKEYPPSARAVLRTARLRATEILSPRPGTAHQVRQKAGKALEAQREQKTLVKAKLARKQRKLAGVAAEVLPAFLPEFLVAPPWDRCSCPRCFYEPASGLGPAGARPRSTRVKAAHTGEVLSILDPNFGFLASGFGFEI